LIVISVALLMDQLKVDDWPRSIVDGSAVKLLMVGLSTRATGSGAAAAGGGGGGGGGTFFLHPEANAISTSANNTALVRVEACNLSLSLILNILLFCFQASLVAWVGIRARALLLNRFTPNRFLVGSLCSELLYSGAIGGHGVNLRVAVARRREHHMDAIGRPARIFVSSRAMGKLHEVSRRNVHDENVEVSWFESTSPRKRNMLAVGTPRGINRIAFPRGQTDHICSIYIHSIYLRRASAPRDKHDVVAGLGIHLGFHFERSGMGDPAQPAAVEIGLVDL
jgi:hypothetical protein